MTILIG